MVETGSESPSLHLSNILDGSRDLLQSLETEKSEDEPAKTDKTKPVEDFEALDSEFEKKDKKFKNKFISEKKKKKASHKKKARRKSKAKAKLSKAGADKVETGLDHINELRKQLQAPEPMGTQGSTHLNFSAIIEQSNAIIKDFDASKDQSQFLNDLRKLNKLNQKRYESEIAEHGQN